MPASFDTRRIGGMLGATFTAIALTIATPAVQAETTLLNVSYDVARELFK
ncbi:MAG: hypothetical protein V7606_1853, partial [Burkholderiales bacterium]